MTLTERINCLQRYDWIDRGMGCNSGGKWIYLPDLRALIDAEPESVAPVAVIALKNAELNNRVCVLEDLLSSAYAIANRNGSDTHWPRFASQLHINGISPITAKTFKVLPSDIDYSTAPPAENLIAELVEALEKAREKLQIECGGNREYKGGVPTQVLFPMIDALLKRAKESTPAASQSQSQTPGNISADS